jgi:hypothetical protein
LQKKLIQYNYTKLVRKSSAFLYYNYNKLAFHKICVKTFMFAAGKTLKIEKSEERKENRYGKRGFTALILNGGRNGRYLNYSLFSFNYSLVKLFNL